MDRTEPTSFFNVVDKYFFKFALGGTVLTIGSLFGLYLVQDKLI